MFGVGFFEIFLICIVLSLAIGPKQLPEVMESVGRFIRLCKQTYYQLKRDVFDHPYKEGGYKVKEKLSKYTAEGFAVPELMDDSESDENIIESNNLRKVLKKKKKTTSKKKSISDTKLDENVSTQFYLLPDDGPFGNGTDMEGEEDLFSYSKKVIDDKGDEI